MSTNDTNQDQPTPLEALENSSSPTQTTTSSHSEDKKELLPLCEHQVQEQQLSQQPPQQQALQQQEYTRRYIQWKEEDIALLLEDLEKPGHYESWKTNKSGYAKRVAEEVFHDILYQDGIKFKVRWLENRVRKYDQVLSVEVNQGGEPARIKLLEKIQREFPFYYRVKRILESDSCLSSPSPAEQKQQSDTNSSTPTAPPQLAHPVSSSSPLTTQSHDHQQTTTPSSACITEATIKAASSPQGEYNNSAWQAIHRRSYPQSTTAAAASTSASTLAPTTADVNHNTLDSADSLKRRKLVHHIPGGVAKDHQLFLMELELESKKMDHDERMQQMKLEQLRLEIELEKIRSGRRSGES